jgi:Phage tail tube protein
MTVNAYSTVGSGISAQLMYCLEAFDGSGTWGVFPTATTPIGVWRPLEFKSETLALKKTTVQGQGLHAGGLFDRLSRRVLTNYDAGGTVSFDLPNRNLNAILQAMTGSPNSTVVGLDTANVIYTPTQLTPGGTSSVPYVYTTGTGSGAYVSFHSPGSTAGISMTWQKGVPTANVPGSTVIEPFSYVGVKISDWEISVETGALVQASLTLDARCEIAGTTSIDQTLNPSVPTLQVFSETGVEGASSTNGYLDPLSVFHFREGTLYTATSGGPQLTSGVLSFSGGISAAANIKSASFKETHALDTNRYFIGSAGFKAEQIENGFRQLTGQFVAEFLSAETYYNAFASDSTTSLQLTFVGGTAGTSGTNSDTVTIIYPNIKLNGESPTIGGPGVITESCAFVALDDNLTVPYQITYVSSDATV